MIYRGSDIKRIKNFCRMTKFIGAMIMTIDNTEMIIWR
jgi:hypothetical protein